MRKVNKIVIAAVAAAVLGACCFGCVVTALIVFRYQPAVVAARGYEMHWPTRPGLLESVSERVQAFFEIRTCDYTILGWDGEGLLFYEEACRDRPSRIWTYNPGDRSRPRRVGAAPGELLQQAIPRSSILEMVRSPGVRPADAEPTVRILEVPVDGLASPDGRWVAVVVRHIYGPEDVIVLSTPKPTPILQATAVPPLTQPPATAGIDGDKVVFTIPVGPEGVQYGAEQTGPMALAVAPDGTFWIADTQGNRLLHYDHDGALLGRIGLNGYGAYGAADVEAVGSDILVLCCGKVLRLTAGGNLLATYDIPDDLGPEGGLTGLAVGDYGEILLEFEMGAEIAQLVNAQGVLDPLPLPGYTHEGSLYKAQLARGWTSHGSITAGSTRIDVTVPETLAGLWLLGFAPGGGLCAVVEEMERRAPVVRVDQVVRLYDPSGVLLGSARVPLSERYTYVQHSLAVGPDGAVYALLTRPDYVQVVRLEFSAKLEPILPSQAP